MEIWEQMEGRVDAWISGIGSAGTFTGVSRFLKRKNAEILCVGHGDPVIHDGAKVMRDLFEGRKPKVELAKEKKD